MEVQGSEPFHIAQPGEHVRDQWKQVGVVHHDLVQLPVVLHQMEGAFLLLDEEHRSSNRRFRQTDSSIGQILSEECVKILLFCGGEGEHPPSGEFGIRMKLYGMVPCLTRGEMGKGFFREDVCEVFVALWNGALRRMDSLGLSLFCKSLRGGRRGTDAFLPFRSEKDRVNRVLLSERRRGGGLSWWGVRFGQNMPIAAGGASCH